MCKIPIIIKKCTTNRLPNNWNKILSTFFPREQNNISDNDFMTKNRGMNVGAAEWLYFLKSFFSGLFCFCFTWWWLSCCTMEYAFYVHSRPSNVWCAFTQLSLQLKIFLFFLNWNLLYSTWNLVVNTMSLMLALVVFWCLSDWKYATR